jgi:hypothetical protein
MRKYVILAMVALASMVMASVASADDIQSIDAKLSPTKLDKKKYKPMKMVIDIRTNNNTGAAVNADQPPTAVRTDVDFPKNLKFDTNAVPKCKVDSNTLSNYDAAGAKQQCGKKSQVSIDGLKNTSGTITIDTNPAVADGANQKLTVTVTAFNGKEKNSIYLHTDPTGIPTKPVLVGKLVKGKAPYGNTLQVTIPNLGVGGISQFLTTVKAGKYIQGRCKSKKNPFAATTTFTDKAQGPAKVTDTTQTTCKQKKSKKKKK